MIFKLLSAIWPAALIACSSSPAAPPASNGAAGASSSSSSGNGGTGGTVTSVAGASSGGDVSVSGGGGAPAVAGGGAGGSAGALAGGGAGGGVSGSGGMAGGGVGGASGSSGACSGLFCEDFEEGQGQLDPTKWFVQMGAGGVEMVEQDTVAHGKYAFHVHGTGAAGDFALIITKNAPAALHGAGPVFGRAYVYAAANFGAHIQLGFAGTTHDPAVAASITTKGMNFNYMEFAEFSGSWQLGFDLFAPDPAIAKGFVEEASYPPAHDKPPAMTWSCVEWEFGDNPELMLLWVDGKQIDQFDVDHISYTSTTKTPGSVLNGKSSGIIGGFDFFGFGFHTYGTSAGVIDRYYDDIVLDTKRVNCLPQ